MRAFYLMTQDFGRTKEIREFICDHVMNASMVLMAKHYIYIKSKWKPSSHEKCQNGQNKCLHHLLAYYKYLSSRLSSYQYCAALRNFR